MLNQHAEPVYATHITYCALSLANRITMEPDHGRPAPMDGNAEYGVPPGTHLLMYRTF
jgi:hypothetical protein